MNRKLSLYLSFLVGAWLALAGCKNEFSSAEAPAPAKPSKNLVASDAVSMFSHPGRALAANCFQCHGTDGFAGEMKIAGESYSELLSELREYRAKSPGTEIMSFHAQPYTDAEIVLIADYFSKQK